MSKSDKSISILDCTLRDGGYITNWHFNLQMVREVYRSASKAGIDIVEFGYRQYEKSKRQFGKWKYCHEEDLQKAVDGIQGAKIAVMADFSKAHLADFLPAKESIIDWVRIASHKKDIFNCLDFASQLKDLGYHTSVNAMGYTHYSKNERVELAKSLSKYNIDCLYVADSYGSLFPHQIKECLAPLLNESDVKTGFHAHNNLQMAFANSLEAILVGVDFIDSTLFGMGRGAGNLPTEIIVAYLQTLCPEKYKTIPVLNCIDLYLIPLYRNNPWGYNLPYMISGVHQSHPNYAKSLVDRKRYTTEDIWKALDMVKQQGAEEFNLDLLNQIIQSGLNPTLQTTKKVSRSVSYKKIHSGKTFLILGNGPTLKSHRNQIQQFIDKKKPIVLGANNLGNLFIPDYHAFTSVKRLKKYADTVHLNSNLLIGEHIDPQTIREYIKCNYELIRYNDILKKEFDLTNEGVITVNCRTVSVLLCAVAIVMGARQIYVAGLDGYQDTGIVQDFFFYPEEDRVTDKSLLKELHEWCAYFLEEIDQCLRQNEGKGIHFLTPTNYR